MTSIRSGYMARYALENKESIRLYKKNYAEENKERIRTQQHKKYTRTATKIRASVKLWGLANPDRVRAFKRKWEKNNPAKRNANTARRYAAKTRATPAWANQFFIEEAYDLALRRTRSTGIEWNVDHIVPLRSKVVCGLHVEHNLRVIPKLENCKKNNRIWPDMPEAA